MAETPTLPPTYYLHVPFLDGLTYLRKVEINQRRPELIYDICHQRVGYAPGKIETTATLLLRLFIPTHVVTPALSRAWLEDKLGWYDLSDTTLRRWTVVDSTNHAPVMIFQDVYIVNHNLDKVGAVATRHGSVYDDLCLTIVADKLVPIKKPGDDRSILEQCGLRGFAAREAFTPPPAPKPDVPATRAELLLLELGCGTEGDKAQKWCETTARYGWHGTEYHERVLRAQADATSGPSEF